MLASSSLTGTLVQRPVEHLLGQQLRPSTSEQRSSSHLHATASALLAAAATASPVDVSTALAANMLSCSPPNTYTRTFTRTRMAAPAASLPVMKRRRGRRGGGAGDEEVPDGDDGGSGFGGGDDGSGGWWGHSWEEDGEDSGAPRPLVNDIYLLWAVFCVVCFLRTVQHVLRGTAVPRGPPGVLAALATSHLRLQHRTDAVPQ